MVFLAGSVPDREGFERVPEAPFVVEQAVVALARAVFAEEGKIVFGAHPSISPLVAAVASEYALAQTGEAKNRRVRIYQSRAFSKVLPDETWDMCRFGFADLVWTEAKNGEEYRPGEPASLKCPQSLKHMRESLIEDCKPRAMVVIGGMQGVIEEADLYRKFCESNPNLRLEIFTAAYTGGVAKRLVKEDTSRFLTVLETAWLADGGSWNPESMVADPRARTLPPYAAMMQWLVQRIATVD
jgi:hypothetical protein